MKDGTNGTLAHARSAHLVGAGGAGMSGLGRILHARGLRLTGHDRARSAFVEDLEALGIPVALGPSRAEHLPESAECVVRSAAIGLDDPQLVRAAERGLPILKYGRALAQLAPPRRTLAVAGTHGKTTSSWMLHHALRGLADAVGRGAPAPGALVGGTCRALGTNAIPPGDGGWFVVEACEYDRTFLGLSPEGALITNVEADHLDCYGTLGAIEEAFARFADRLHPEGLLVLGREVPEQVEHAAACEVWRLGRELELELTAEARGHFRFRLRGPGWRTGEVELRVPGARNVENAALALGLALGLAGRPFHLNEREAAAGALQGLARFVGVERRFEPWGTAGGVEVVHDYAHHPTEVRVVLEMARRALPGKPLHVLFQPHQHSRTARFLQAFVESLRSADRVVVADVYGARPSPLDAAQREELAGAEELALRLRRAGVDALHGGDLGRSTSRLVADLPGGSAALILGAGDVDSVRDDLLGQLALRGPAARGPLV